LNFWDPYDPVSYLLHTVVGTGGILAAILAIMTRKGSRNHVRSGTIFVVTAAIAAGTALVFSVTVLSPPAIASSILTFALLAGAILALRDRGRCVAVGEVVTAFTMGFVGLALVFMSVMARGFGAEASQWGLLMVDRPRS
jgi:hypothetical protein